MKWREEFSRVVIWLDKIGTNNVTYGLERVGPMFRVYTGGDKWFGASDDLWTERWYFAYKKAEAELRRRILVTHEEIEWVQ